MTALVRTAGKQRAALMDEREREAVVWYSRIAEASGALLSLQDLVELLAIDATEEELEKSISSDESLSKRVVVDSGRVLLRRDGAPGSLRRAIEEDGRRRERAIHNLRAAGAFAPLLGKDLVFVAVGGTNSYLSAAEGDDIDFYCITKTNGMWAFMLKALILARIYDVFRKPPAPFCFSFVMDERRAMEELSAPKGALYARDSLNAKVISGGPAYRGILENAYWMRSHFPATYDRRLRELGSSEGPSSTARRKSRALNLLLFLTVGTYVALKAWLLNRRLAKGGRSDATFKTWVEPGRLEYASRRYLELGRMYQALENR